MKKILYSVISVTLLFLGSACKKDNTVYRATANINVINAAIGVTGIKVNPGATSGFSYAQASTVGFGANSMFGNFTGSNTITVVSSTDTTQTLFKRTVDLQPISSLYISGQAPAIDTMYRVEQNFPTVTPVVSTNPDNSVYIRFVNLSPNSVPLNINILSSTTNEVTALPYQGISAFKKYAASFTTPNYVFEIRNAATNAVLFTTPSNLVPTANIRYKTISIAIKGLMGTTSGTNAFGAFLVTYN